MDVAEFNIPAPPDFKRTFHAQSPHHISASEEPEQSLYKYQTKIMESRTK